ncbi:hypothetical protein ACFSKL_06870 [Belliella marina]|uniref:PKD domain-containing protein n=1 Tax=Belliella marina TaxID=1644146 RepID=A0ABW4VIH3_9BACT
MKKVLLVIIGCFWVNLVLGQGVIGSSPDAMAQFRQANAGVSQYTGAVNVSIPLGTISGRELETSVSLNYAGSGHRVQDVASSVGLGWSLSAGGMITRIVRGAPDDLQNGYCHNVSDTEPDMFFFSFMGRSGSFVLDRNGEAILYPYQNLKIKSGICDYKDMWYIIDEMGNQYSFGKEGYIYSNESIETTTVQSVQSNVPEINYVSTWYLKSIKSLNGTDEMKFFYTDQTNYTYTNYYFTQNGDWCAQSIRDESSIITVQTRYLSYISAHGGTISFNWNDVREDLPGAKSLKGITVKNHLGKVLNQYDLVYSYFTSPGAINNCQTNCLRLKLDYIYDKAPDPLYAFDYNLATKLPRRDSRNYDYMGFYNANTVNSWLPAIPEFGQPGASREPNATNAQANMLTKINERGGAYRSFIYEGNRAWLNNSNTLVPGVRISKMITGDGNGNEITKEYSYLIGDPGSNSSGILFRKPISAIILNSQIVRHFSHSPIALLDVNGVNVGYSRVVEKVVGKGKTVSHYTNYDTRPDGGTNENHEVDVLFLSSVTPYFWERGNLRKTEIYDNNDKAILFETIHYDYTLPVKRTLSAYSSIPVFCNGNNFASHRFNYEIVSKPLVIEFKETEAFDQTDGTNTRKIKTVEKYKYDPVTLQLVESSLHNSAEPNEEHITRLKYVTNNGYAYRSNCENDYMNRLAFIVKGDNRFGQLFLLYQQFLDCIGSADLDAETYAILVLRAKNAISTIVETQHWLKRGSVEVFLGASLNQFRMEGTDNNWVVPSSEWASKKSSSFSGTSISSSGQFQRPNSFALMKHYPEYENTNGKLIKEIDRGNIATAYTYSNNFTTLESVTSNPGSQEHKTSYIYEPGIGVSKETDVNGRSTSFEYDFLGRMRLVRDHEGNILERYRYHYKNQKPSFRINANNTQVMPGQMIEIDVSDMILPTGGDAEFVWDMDNGTVYEDNRLHTSVSYSTPGLYSVKVVMLTNEYEPFTKYLNILVLSPMQVSICADGPQEIDVCGQDPPFFGACTTTNNQPYSATMFHANFSPSNATGCLGVYNYHWQYKNVNSSFWITMSNQNSSSAWFPNFGGAVGNYQIRCTVTDSCNNTVTANSWINYYKSNPSCTGGGVIIEGNSNDGG